MTTQTTKDIHHLMVVLHTMTMPHRGFILKTSTCMCKSEENMLNCQFRYILFRRKGLGMTLNATLSSPGSSCLNTWILHMNVVNL